MDLPVANGPTPARTLSRKQIVLLVLVGFFIVTAIGGLAYMAYENQFVFSDKASVQAPLINLAPHQAGELKKVLVSEGDLLSPYRAVARVGDEMLMTQVSGVAVIVHKNIGAIYSPSTPVVTMIEPKELRIVAQIEEDKGLKDVHVGQEATFTVDAFGSKQYHGTVESVSQTNRSGDVVFNISDQRETQEFDVKIRYDIDLYPELQNGMSARVWIIK